MLSLPCHACHARAACCCSCAILAATAKPPDPTATASHGRAAAGAVQSTAGSSNGGQSAAGSAAARGAGVAAPAAAAEAAPKSESQGHSQAALSSPHKATMLLLALVRHLEHGHSPFQRLADTAVMRKPKFTTPTSGRADAGGINAAAGAATSAQAGQCSSLQGLLRPYLLHQMYMLVQMGDGQQALTCAGASAAPAAAGQHCPTGPSIGLPTTVAATSAPPGACCAVGHAVLRSMTSLVLQDTAGNLASSAELTNGGLGEQGCGKYVLGDLVNPFVIKFERTTMAMAGGSLQ